MKRSWLSVVLCLTAIACSTDSSSPASDAGPDPDSGADPDSGKIANDPKTPFSELPSKCQGFEVAGLKYSPGGDVLPNTCAPFDNLRNNPYAIRCIDADSSYSSGYPGDEFCILPPRPELGTQVRVGPSDYANVPAEFLMQAGDEKVDYYYTNATTDADHYYYRTNLRMRAGSHHMIIRVMSADHKDGFSAETDVSPIAADSDANRSFGGAQRPDADRPEGILDVPPENSDMGEFLKAGQQFSFNLHHFNVTDEPILREAWVNIWYKDPAEVGRRIQGITIVGNPLDLNIPAGERRVLHYACSVKAATRIITLNGHRHASTSRFGVWVERKDGTNQSLYESFNYNDMPTYQYDSLSKNPVADVDRRSDGAWTGLLELQAGDKLHFVCDVTNKLDRALHFANEVTTGEMCILFGTRTGGSLCSFVNRVVE
ncbi:MAG TPA: hypothetical protein VJR89_28685 [Polyangiales bacterium]|nr:hypothetical protein [Polyangiales bacterium]